MQHHIFKVPAAHALTTYKTTRLIETRMLDQSANGSNGQILGKPPNSRRCYMCQHEYLTRKTSCNSTLFKCALCGEPVCKPFKEDCWDMHLKGLPKTRRES